MRARLPILAGVAAVALLAAPAGAQTGCPLSSCVLGAFPALAPIVLEGGEQGAFLFSMVSGLPAEQVPLVELSAPLDAGQQALLGCGPYWGSVCERTGIDLRGAEAGVLMQGWVGPGAARFVNGTLVQRPGPFLSGIAPNPAYDLNRDGTISGLEIPALLGSSAGQQFVSEMAALSFNLQLVLVAFSSRPPGSSGSDLDIFDPDDPYSQSAGQCSFLQPQFCSSVKAFMDIAKPPSLDVPAGGNTRFGRRDFVRTGQGCLPPRSVLPLEGARRPGRCPTR
jgi:hypothetical protein